MPQRLIKIILPQGRQADDALELIRSKEDLTYWQEETSEEQLIVGILLDSAMTEELMDQFEKRFGSVMGFKLILLPVEASLPRPKVKKEVKEEEDDQPKKTYKLRISREELYDDVVESTKLNRVFILMTVLSTVVVAVGLLRDNVAVIIGAMVIAPFLGPNVGLALSNSLGDRKLGMDSLKTLLSGGLIVLALAFGIGYFFDVDPSVREIASRTSAGHGDIILALASGSAGVLAFTTGASAAVIGVMVAVALLPPLTVVGILLGIGDFQGATGAFLLFFTNVICVNLAGILTFRWQGVTPGTWWEVKKARKASIRALIIWIFLLAVLAVFIWYWYG